MQRLPELDVHWLRSASLLEPEQVLDVECVQLLGRNEATTGWLAIVHFGGV